MPAKKNKDFFDAIQNPYLEFTFNDSEKIKENENEKAFLLYGLKNGKEKKLFSTNGDWEAAYNKAEKMGYQRKNIMIYLNKNNVSSQVFHIKGIC